MAWDGKRPIHSFISKNNFRNGSEELNCIQQGKNSKIYPTCNVFLTSEPSTFHCIEQDHSLSFKNHFNDQCWNTFFPNILLKKGKVRSNFCTIYEGGSISTLEKITMVKSINLITSLSEYCLLKDHSPTNIKSGKVECVIYNNKISDGIV